MAESSRANRNRNRNRNRRRVQEHDIFQSHSGQDNVSLSHSGQHDIFLSHSGQDKPFVEQLFHDFRRAGKHPFFDQDSDSLPKAEKFAKIILDAAEQCQMGVVVLSAHYLKSKWPMLELSKFVESKVRLFPLFFKLSPSALKQDKVESKWKPAWRALGMDEEVVESWGKAVKALRDSNGLEYAKYAKSEYKYREDAVREICKKLPPILKSKTTDIQGYERLCKTTLSMFEGNEYLGLYGMAGAGKSTLCKAMCNYSQGEFGANVYRVELTSDQAIEQEAGIERLTRLKQVLKCMGVDNGILERVVTEEQGWEQLKETLTSKSRIFLAIDNVGNSRSSKEEAQSYLKVGLPVGSKVLVTSRSRDILEDVLGCHEYCKPLPRLEEDEALKLFLSIATPKKSSSSLNEEERKIVERCMSDCQYADSGYTSTQFHPLILKALGSYFHDVDNIEVVNWKEALENNDKLQRSGDAKNVKFVLGLNYESLSDEKKLIYLDTVLYPHDTYALIPWWTPRERPIFRERSFDAWVLWIAEVHDVSQSNARILLKELLRLSLLEDSRGSFGERKKPFAHDLFKDFVRGLVESEGSMEWRWWTSQEEVDIGNEVKLKRLVLNEDKSLIGRPPRKLQQWRSLVFLELRSCNGFGLDNVLELGGLNKLRVLVVQKCAQVRRIICSCNNDEHNPKLFEEKKGDHCRGCMRELCSVKLQELDSLEDISFLRHCPNIKILRVLWCNRSIYPSRNSYFHNPHGMDLSHLKELHTLIVQQDLWFQEGFDTDTFSKWMCNTLQLQKLGALEYAIYDRSMWFVREKNCGAITIDLSEDVSTSNLSVLSIRLPSKVEEIKGLQFLSNLRTLNLNSCEGLRKLPNLKPLYKLKEICFKGCPFSMENHQSLGACLPQNTRRYIDSEVHEIRRYKSEVLSPCFGCFLSCLQNIREDGIYRSEHRGCHGTLSKSAAGNPEVLSALKNDEFANDPFFGMFDE